MGMSVAELQRTISAKEMAEGEAYALIEPFGFEMHNMMSAKTAQAAVSPWCDKTPPLNDFLFDFLATPEERPQKTPEQIMSVFKAMAGK